MSGTRMLIVVLAVTALTVAGCGRRGRLEAPAPHAGAGVVAGQPAGQPVRPTAPTDGTSRFPLDFLI